LAKAKNVARTAQLEIRFCDFEAVIGAPQRLDSFPRQFAKRRAVK
jgi:hypothetical protein